MSGFGFLQTLRGLAGAPAAHPAGEDSRLRFGARPPPGDSGFCQWRDAMRMVARLPGGIPHDFRRRLWLTLAERHLASRGVDWAEAQRRCLSEWSGPGDQQLGEQIVKDLHRTGCSLFCGADAARNQALLKRVLLAFARWNPAVGYCQGFNVLAALILQVMDRREADAVKVMVLLVEGVLPRGYFADNLRGLSADMAVLRDLLARRLPALAAHLDRLQLAASDAAGTSYEPPLTNVFTMQWFLTLFCNCLPQPAVLRVWDLVFLEGNEVLLRTALAIWDGLAERILAVNSADEFYSIMGVLTREMLEFGLMDTNNLIKTVVNLAPFPFPELNELRDKYLYNITPWTQCVSTAAKRGLKIFYSDDDEETDEDDEKIAVAAAYGISTVFRSPRRKDAAQREQTPSSLSALYYSGTMPDRERLALDISALKQQYAKLRERQRQAHIILTAACSRQPLGAAPPSTSPSPAPPVAINHLLLGRSALVPARRARGRRAAPPPGAVPPPARPRPGAAAGKPTKPSAELVSPQLQLPEDVGETLHWKDATIYKKQKIVSIAYSSMDEKTTDNEAETTSPEASRGLESDGGSGSDSDSSTSTELCDEPDRLSDFDSEEATSLSEAAPGPSLSAPFPAARGGLARASSAEGSQPAPTEEAPAPSSTHESPASPAREETPVTPGEHVSLGDQREQQAMENGTEAHTKTPTPLTVSADIENLQCVPSGAIDKNDFMVKETVQGNVTSETSISINGSNKYFHSTGTVTFLENNLINSDMLVVPESESDKTIISQSIDKSFRDTSNIEINQIAKHSIKELEPYVTTATEDNSFSSVILDTKKTENLATDTDQFFPETSTVSVVTESVDKYIFSQKNTSSSDSKFILEPSEKERGVDYDDMSAILEFNQRLHGLHDQALRKAPVNDGDSDYLQMSELLEIDHKMHSGRRNSERALKIIQENSEILQRILQCQMRRASKLSEEGSNGTNGASEEDSDSVKAASVPSSASAENVPFFLSADCKKLSESILSRTVTNDSFQEHQSLSDEPKVPVTVSVTSVSKQESNRLDIMTSLQEDGQTKETSLHISPAPVCDSHISDTGVDPTVLNDTNSEIFPNNTEAKIFDKETGKERSFERSFSSYILSSNGIPPPQKGDKPLYTTEVNSAFSMSFPNTASNKSDSSTDFKTRATKLESEDVSSFWELWKCSTNDESSIDSEQMIKSCASHMLKEGHSGSERSFRPIIVHSSSLDKTGFRDEKLPRPLSDGESQDPHYSNVGRKYVPTIPTVDCSAGESAPVSTLETLPRKQFEQFSYTPSFAVRENTETGSFSLTSSVLDLQHPTEVSQMLPSFLSRQETRGITSSIAAKDQQMLQSSETKHVSIESELEFHSILTHSLTETKEDEILHRSGKEIRPLSPNVTEMLNRSSSGALQGGRSKVKKDFVSPPPSPFRRYTSPVRKAPSLERPVSLHFSKGSSSFDSAEDGKMRLKTSPLYKSFSMLSVNEAGEIHYAQYDTTPRHRKKDPLRRRTSTDLSISFSSSKSKSPKATSPLFSPSKLKEIGVSFPPIKSLHQAESPTKSTKFSPFPTRAPMWQPKELGIKLGLYSSNETSGRSSSKKL